MNRYVNGTANDFLMSQKSARGRSARFPVVNTKVGGTIVGMDVAQQQNMDGSLKVFDNGEPMMQMIITVQTTLREDAEDDGLRSLYAKGGKGGMLDAVREVALPFNGLQEGGLLTVKYTGDAKTRNGFNAKQYAAQYTPPATPVPDFGADERTEEAFDRTRQDVEAATRDLPF